MSYALHLVLWNNRRVTFEFIIFLMSIKCHLGKICNFCSNLEKILISHFLSCGNISNRSLARCSTTCNNLTLGHPPEPLFTSRAKTQIPSCNLPLSSFHQAEQRAAKIAVFPHGLTLRCWNPPCFIRMCDRDTRQWTAAPCTARPAATARVPVPGGQRLAINTRSSA